MTIKKYIRGIRDSAPQGYILARVSKGKGPLELVKAPAGFLTPNGVVIPSGAITLTGDVTGSGTGSVVTTIANDVVSNAKLANMAAWTVKVRNAGSSGDPSDAALADFTEETAPEAGDFLIGFLASGELRKFDLANIVTVSYVPLSMGTEPLTFVSNGSGQPMLIPFNP